MRVLLILLIAVSTSYSEIIIDEFVNILKELKHYFRVNCVYISYNQDSGRTQETTHMLIELNNVDILTAAVSFSSLNNVQCERNRPLIVLHEMTISDLKQLSSMENMCQMIWLLFMDQDLELDDMNIPFDCEFLVAKQESNTVVLTEVYRISPLHPLQYHHFGTWSPADGLSCISTDLYRRRNNLQGLALTTGFKKTKRLEESEEEEKRNSPTGYYGEIWKRLEEKMNFTSQYLNPEDNMFGGKIKNGTWTGVLGMMQRREVEVTNVAFVMSSLRMEVVDFTVPLLNIKTYLMIRQPETNALKWTAFLKPFAWQLWLVVIMCIIILTTFMAILFFLGLSCGGFKIKDVGFTTAMFIEFGIFCMQGQNFSTFSTPLRLTFMTSYLTAVVLVASYSASFISHLTLRRPTLPFNTFREFMKDGSYQLGMMPNSAQLDYFKSSGVELLNQIYNKMIKPHENSLPKSDYDGLQRMCRERFAFVMSSYSLMYQGEVKVCSYVQIPQAFFPGSIGITIRKRSTYKGLFNYVLQSMHQSGIFSVVYNRFTYHLRRDVLVPVPVITITDVTPILILLSVGILLAIFFSLSEICAKKYINVTQTKKRTCILQIYRNYS